MATPNNKSREQLFDEIDNLKSQLAKEVKNNKENETNLNTEIANLKKENLELKKANSILSTDEDIIKKILSLYAQQNTYLTIFDKVSYSGFQGSISYIKDVCMNINELTSSMQLYYKEELEAYEKSIKINPSLINDSLIQVLQQNINDATQDLEGLTDVKEKSNLRAEIRGHAKELKDLTKNVMDDNNEVFVDEQVKKIKDNLQKRNQRILNEFDPTQFKVVK